MDEIRDLIEEIKGTATVLSKAIGIIMMIAGIILILIALSM